MNEKLECFDKDDECAGPVKYREPLSGTGTSFVRCEHHWTLRLDWQDQHQATKITDKEEGTGWQE